eukprot:m51a1_g4952 hypothetical protein (304) ;mRNA; r:338011-339228
MALVVRNLREELREVKAADQRERIRCLEELVDKLQRSHADLARSCDTLVEANAARDRAASDEKRELELQKRRAETRSRQLATERDKAVASAKDASEIADALRAEIEVERRSRAAAIDTETARVRREIGDCGLGQAREQWERERRELTDHYNQLLHQEREEYSRRLADLEQRVRAACIEDSDRRCSSIEQRLLSRISQTASRVAAAEQSVTAAKAAHALQAEALNKKLRESEARAEAARAEAEALRGQLAEAKERHDKDVEAVCERSRQVIARKERAVQERDGEIMRLRAEITGVSQLVSRAYN